MHKDEFLKALIAKDKEKLVGFFTGQRQEIILFTSLLNNAEVRVWVGDFLLTLANERADIPPECYAFIFQLKDEKGKGWVFNSDKYYHNSAKPFMKLLQHLVEKKLMTPDEALAISFYTPPNLPVTDHLAWRDAGIARAPIPAYLISWMHSAKDEGDKFAKKFLQVCKERYLPRIDSHENEMVELLERFQAKPELHEQLSPLLLFDAPKHGVFERSLFVDLYINTQRSANLENRLCVLICKIISENPSYSSVFMGGFYSRSYQVTRNNLNQILEVEAGQREYSPVLLEMLQTQGPDWVAIIEESVSSVCGSSLYPLLLLMMRKILTECDDEQIVQSSIDMWFTLMFRQGSKSHFCLMSYRMKNSQLLSNLVFEVLGLCMEKSDHPLGSMLNMPKHSLLGLFQAVDASVLKRLINYILSHPKGDKKNIASECKFGALTSQLELYCVPVYFLFSADSYFLQAFITTLFSSHHYSLDMLGELVGLDMNRSAAEIVKNERPDWADCINGQSQGLLYLVLLHMIRDEIKREGSPYVKEDISAEWINLLFSRIWGKHIYAMGRKIKNKHLWNIVFEIFELCAKQGSLKQIAIENTERIFEDWDVSYFKRFVLFMLSPSTMEEYKQHFIRQLLMLLSVHTEQSMTISKLKSEEFTSLMIDTVIPLAMSDPELRAVVFDMLGSWSNAVCERAVEKKLLALKFDSFSSEEKGAIRSSKNVVARYQVFKNDKSSSWFSSVFPDWEKLVDNIDSTVRDHLLSEACLESIQRNKISESSAIQKLMESRDVLGTLIRLRNFFTAEQYRTLLKTVCDTQIAGQHSPFVMFYLEKEDEGLKGKLEELRVNYNCPILLRLNNVIKIYGFYDGAWKLTQLDKDDFDSFSNTEWGISGGIFFAPAGAPLITAEIYQAITASKGHDFHMRGAHLLAELASVDIEQKHFDAARDCLDRIPSHRQCMPSYMQDQLVTVSLKLYREGGKQLRDLFRAIKHARALNKSESNLSPVSEQLLAQQDGYFKQAKMLEKLFEWDAPLKNFYDDTFHAAAFSFQCALLTKLEQNPASEPELIAHAERVLKWLVDKDLNLTEDYSRYQNSARPKTINVLSWISGVDILVSATEKLYAELVRVKAKNQFTQEIEIPLSDDTKLFKAVFSAITGLKK